jgi:protoporphyrinogen/coproporphyrinogen III oxidase
MKCDAQVIIIGAGISGLATAWWLHKAGIDVLVLEKGEAPGGTMQTVRDGGWLIETGPNSALETTPLFKSLFNDVGLTDQLVYANEAGNNRYIARNGRLHPLPMTPPAFFRSKLWSLGGKLRLTAEPFIGRAKEEETIAQFVRRRLGQEFLDYAINPFVAGIFAGDPGQLSVRAAFPKLYALEEKYGGLIKGSIRGARERKKRQEKAKDRAKMFSFKDGMQSFPDAIARGLEGRVLTGIEVRKIVTGSSRTSAQARSRTYRIEGVRESEGIAFDADVVVTAAPSVATAELVEAFDAPLAATLREIFYPPVTEVFQGYRASDVRRALDGFGYLIPEKEHRSILGTIWTSVLFEGRAPSGHVAFTTFVGGARQPELAAYDDASLGRSVTEELAAWMQTTAPPVYSRITRWPHAIPQYRLGHLDIVAEMERFERAHPGWFITGNFRGGISVGDCVMSSERTAQAVIKLLGEA